MTDNKIDCVLEGNSNENFKYYVSSLRRKNLNRVILAQLNTNYIRNKCDLLAGGIKGKLDILMINETFPSRQFYIEGFRTPYKLHGKCHGGGIIVYVRESQRKFRLSQLK